MLKPLPFILLLTLASAAVPARAALDSNEKVTGALVTLIQKHPQAAPSMVADIKAALEKFSATLDQALPADKKIQSLHAQLNRMEALLWDNFRDIPKPVFEFFLGKVRRTRADLNTFVFYVRNPGVKDAANARQFWLKQVRDRATWGSWIAWGLSPWV